jgi:hypothetical protein
VKYSSLKINGMPSSQGAYDLALEKKKNMETQVRQLSRKIFKGH